MRRIPLTLRALVLVPLLAVLVDSARATLACGPQAQTCLEAAGRGWLGSAGLALLGVYSVLLALAVARIAGGAAVRDRPLPVVRLWLTGSVGVAAAIGGQALLAGATGDGAALGGGWLELIGFCLAAGGVLALSLRIAPAAAALVRAAAALRPACPRRSGARALPAAADDHRRSRPSHAGHGRARPAPLLTNPRALRAPCHTRAPRRAVRHPFPKEHPHVQASHPRAPPRRARRP